MTDDLNAAVAAAALGSEERFRELLRSVVEVARAIFAAKASSVLLLDEATVELVDWLRPRRGRRGHRIGAGPAVVGPAAARRVRGPTAG